MLHMIHDFEPRQFTMGGAAFGCAVVCVTSLVSMTPLSPTTALISCLVGGGFAFLIYFVAIYIELHRSSRADDVCASASLVRSDVFFTDADANIGSHYSDHWNTIRQLLRRFQADHGPDSVWILPHPDSDGLASDEVFLVVDELARDTIDALHMAGAGPVTRLTRTRRMSLFPWLKDRRRVYTVVWD